MRKTTFTYLMAVALIATNAAGALAQAGGGGAGGGEAGAAELLQAAQLAGLDDQFHETCIMEPMG